MMKVTFLRVMALALGCAFSSSPSLGQTITRSVDLIPGRSGTAVFAVPDGYSFGGAAATAGVISLGASTKMNGVTLQPVSVTFGDAPSERTKVTVRFQSGAPRFTGRPSKGLRTHLKSLVANPEDVSVSKSVSQKRRTANTLDTDSEGTVDDIRVAPLLTTAWGQARTGGEADGAFAYNLSTPDHAPCGCIATALAQLMRYHRFPLGSREPVTHACAVEDVVTNLTSSTAAYDWDALPESPTVETDADALAELGRLCSDAGIAVYMNYGANGSGALMRNVANALKDVFGYSSAHYLSANLANTNFTVYAERAILANLDAGYPVVVGVKDKSRGAEHAIVADGYGYSDGVLHIHFRMGWYGHYDGWYRLDALSARGYTFDSVSEIIFNIFPTDSATHAILSGRLTDGSGLAVAHHTVQFWRIESAGETAKNPIATVSTGAEGVYAAILPEGTYRVVTATAGGALTNEVTLVSNAGVASPDLSSLGDTFWNWHAASVIQPANGNGTLGNSWGNDFVIAREETPESDTVNMIILSPPAYVEAWNAYAAMRKTSHPHLAFRVVDTEEIYAQYPIPSEGVRNHAESIHKFLRSFVPEHGVEYVLLGGAWIDAQSLDAGGGWIKDGEPVYFAPSESSEGERMSVSNCVPGILAKPFYGSLGMPTADAFYACLDLEEEQTYPWCSGSDTSYFVEMFAKGANDYGVDVIVSRLPLKPVVANGRTYGPLEVFAAYTNKLARAESASFSGRGRLASFWNQNTTTSNVDGRLPVELEFYDDAPNFFAEDRPIKSFDDVEEVQRTALTEHLLKYRPVLSVDTVNDQLWTRGCASAEEAFAVFKTHDYDYIFNDSHGMWDGSNGVGYNSSDFLTVTGLTLFNDASIPCETGPQELTVQATVAGIQRQVSYASFGETVVLAPLGGCLASVNNAVYGFTEKGNIYTNIYSYVLLHGGMKAFLADHLDAGHTWFQTHLDALASAGTWLYKSIILAEHTLFGDPLVRATPPEDLTVTDNRFPVFARNIVTEIPSLAVSGTNAVLNLRHTDSGLLRFHRDEDARIARMKVMQSISTAAREVIFDGVEGGVGRSVTFEGDSQGRVVITNATGRFYLGGVSNATEIAVYGENVILDADGFDTSHLRQITLVTPSGGTNVLRGVKDGSLRGVAIVAHGGTVNLESKNLFAGNRVTLDGATFRVGIDPVQGSREISTEPVAAVFAGTGAIVVPTRPSETALRPAQGFRMTRDETTYRLSRKGFFFLIN